jgi:hypothetical protein
MARRKSLTGQPTCGITMVMNGLREGSQWNNTGKLSDSKEWLEINVEADRIEAVNCLKSAQIMEILPESECPPPLPTSGEGHRPDRKAQVVHDTGHLWSP